MVPAQSLRCPNCGADLAPAMLACPRCASLVHAGRLRTLAAQAETAEASSDLTAALTAWRQALELLPENTTQHAALRERMKKLSAALDGRGPPPSGVGAKSGRNNKAAAAGGAGAVGVALLKSKAILVALFGNGKLLLLGLLKAPTLISMLVYAGFWSGGRGLGMTLGIIGSIYVHEMGHVAALRRYGIDASAPMFIPGFGALVRLKQYPTDAHEEARTGLAGPLWGLAAAVFAGGLALATGWPTARAVASLGASINLFNLVPVWQLDGSRGLKALARRERWIVGGVGLAFGLLLHQWMPTIVGAVTLVRSGPSASHPTGDRRMLALFVTLVASLSVLAWFFE